MTTAQQATLTTAGLAPAQYDDEMGAAFMYDPATATAWLPRKDAARNAEAFASAEVTVEIVAAPKRDRKRASEADHCPGF